MASKTVFIFGATGGIGIEIARAFLDKRWWVVALGRNLSDERFLAKLGASGETPLAERLRYKKIRDFDHRAICELIESCGVPRHQFQVYINAAGRCFYAPFLSASWSDFDRIVKSNLEVSFHVLRHLSEVAKREPTMPLLYVEIGSRAGANVDHPNFSLYAMVKQGQIGLLRSLAAEMAGTRCSFLVIEPRGVNTKLYDKSLGDRQALRKKFEQSLDLLPAEYVARVVLEAVEGWAESETNRNKSSFAIRTI